MTVSLAAPAKVNLRLRVLGRRADGFHEIRTVFQAVDLADEVRVTPGAPGVRLRVTGADVGPVEENLAYRAARAFIEAFGRDGGGGYDLVLEKRIPAGAGLGGGSSDAAAVLRCLAALAAAPPSDEELLLLGAELGSDVPFFLGPSPLASAEGRGEILTPLAPVPGGHLVLALPPVHVSTAEAYRALARGPWEGGGEAPPTVVPRAGGWSEVAATLQNDFEAVVAVAYPEVARSLEALRDAGALGVVMSGSGAASLGVFADRARAEAAAATLAGRTGWTFLAVRTLDRWPGPVRQGA